MKFYHARNVFKPVKLFAGFLVLMTGCTSAPKMTPTPSHYPALPPVARYALSLLGTPYRYGKASRTEGFDCSGFVHHVYERHGIWLPRTVQEMARELPQTRLNDLRSGDLVFFDTNGDTYSHVGLFIKNDEFVHASSQMTGKVMVSSLSNPYWRKHFIGARRAVPEHH